MGIFSSISSVVGIASGVAGLFGSYKGYEASKESEKLSKQRAEDLKVLSDEEYAYNVAEQERALTQNLADMFMETTKNRYDITQQYVQKFSEDYYGMSVRSYHSGGVAEMSATWDMVAKSDGALASQLAQIDGSIKGMERELVLDYNSNLSQLALNRDKMQKDIGYSLSQGLMKADATKWSSFNTGIKSAVSLADVLDEYSN